MRKHHVSFEHGDRDGNVHEVKAFIKEMDDSMTYTLNRWCSRDSANFDPDLAQFAAVREATEKLSIDGKTYSLKTQNNSKKGVPRYYDPDLEKTVLEHLLGYVIRYNDFLIDEERYQESFEGYTLDDQEIPQEDPIKFPARAQEKTESA